MKSVLDGGKGGERSQREVAKSIQPLPSRVEPLNPAIVPFSLADQGEMIRKVWAEKQFPVSRLDLPGRTNTGFAAPGQCPHVPLGHAVLEEFSHEVRLDFRRAGLFGQPQHRRSWFRQALPWLLPGAELRRSGPVLRRSCSLRSGCLRPDLRCSGCRSDLLRSRAGRS